MMYILRWTETSNVPVLAALGYNFRKILNESRVSKIHTAQKFEQACSKSPHVLLAHGFVNENQIWYTCNWNVILYVNNF